MSDVVHCIQLDFLIQLRLPVCFNRTPKCKLERQRVTEVYWYTRYVALQRFNVKVCEVCITLRVQRNLPPYPKGSCLGDVDGGGRDRYSCLRKSHIAGLFTL
jgi:hypothetical protein